MGLVHPLYFLLVLVNTTQRACLPYAPFPGGFSPSEAPEPRQKTLGVPCPHGVHITAPLLVGGNQRHHWKRDVNKMETCEFEIVG